MRLSRKRRRHAGGEPRSWFNEELGRDFLGEAPESLHAAVG
jgi:hypothetical protein